MQKRNALSERQQAALAELLVQPIAKKVAEKLGIPYATLKSWLAKDQVFIREYRRARNAIFDEMIAKLTDASSKAIEVLVKELESKKGSIRIKAATTILNLVFRGKEYQALQEIEELRERIEGTDGDSEPEEPIEATPIEGDSEEE